MPKVNITNEFIKKIKPPIDKSKVQYFDSELTGFMLEVKNTGTKTYYYRFRSNTSQKMIRIGTTTELNFQQAKEKYLELKENQTNPQEHSP
ncbi:Arm DNA-binding domain-containing protein, partial [Aliarcobacter cryaerophilus]|uniref:Arm DNA-binding domain-containing protein n=1 Tax=Aliarcobacter cryaerophilus TaxID=28198 RepID=UPI003DA42442